MKVRHALEGTAGECDGAIHRILECTFLTKGEFHYAR